MVDAPDDLREQALNEGIYIVRVHGEQFVMETPDSLTSGNRPAVHTTVMIKCTKQVLMVRCNYFYVLKSPSS